MANKYVKARIKHEGNMIIACGDNGRERKLTRSGGWREMPHI